MINETVILLAPSNYPAKHRLSKYIETHLGSDYPPYNLYYYDYEPLQKIFSKVIPYAYTKRMTEIGVKAVNEEIIELARKEHPKYAVWASQEYEFQESTFDTIRKEGTIVVGWFSDDVTRFDEYSKWWIPHLDYCVTNTIEAVPKYREVGARIIFTVPIMEGIPIDRDWSNIEGKYDVFSLDGEERNERVI